MLIYYDFIVQLTLVVIYRPKTMGGGEGGVWLIGYGTMRLDSSSHAAPRPPSEHPNDAWGRGPVVLIQIIASQISPTRFTTPRAAPSR